MIYDISKASVSKMPRLEKGKNASNCCFQTSKNMREPLFPMLFPVLGAHVSGAEFLYPDLTWKELCGQMANLVGDSGCNKGQLTYLVEAIFRDFRQQDAEELKKYLQQLLSADETPAIRRPKTGRLQLKKELIGE